MPPFHQCVEDARVTLQRLEPFPVLQFENVRTYIAQGGAQRFQVQGRHGLIGDHHRLIAAQMRPQNSGLTQQPRTDQNGVAALAEIDFEFDHATTPSSCSLRSIFLASALAP